MVSGGRLRRRTEQRLVAGVASGIADRLNAPAGFMRVYVFAACVFVPWVIAAYALAALLIPPRGSDRPDWDNLIAVTRLGVVFFVPTLAFEGGLIVNQPFHGPPGPWIAYLGLVVAGATALLAADYRRGRARTRAEARAVVLAALPVAGCAAALALALELAPGVRWERWAPGVAVVGALALAGAARRGRAAPFRSPAVLAVALAGLVVASELRLDGGVGDARVMPPPAASGERVVVRRAVGDLTVDLRDVARSGRAAIVEATLGVGTLSVYVPERVRVQVDARVGSGVINAYWLPDQDFRQGFDQRVAGEMDGLHGQPKGPPIRLELDVGLGGLNVDRGRPEAG